MTDEFNLNWPSVSVSMLEAAKADGVLCNVCAAPHDFIVERVKEGSIDVEMDGLGHIWVCSNCKGKYH